MMTPHSIRIFPRAEDVATAFAEDFQSWSRQQLKHRERLTVALSGGSTPKRLFEIWGQSPPSTGPSWNRIHLFWGDERCVPPTDPESNYGVAQQLWFSRIPLSEDNIHRVRGEHEPEFEQARYAAEIERFVKPAEISPSDGALPTRFPGFDLILLGMGSDGHIASIFPDRMDLFHTTEVCSVAVHPKTGQRRITLTGPTILATGRIVFLITGLDKASVLRRVLKRVDDYQQFPAAQIVGPQVEYFLDESAAAELQEKTFR